MLDGPLGRCGPQPAEMAEAGLDYRVLRNAEAGRFPAVMAGSGDTVAVLLHQTDGNGLCGWLEHVPALIADPGVSVLAIDLCTYGAAECRPGAHRCPGVRASGGGGQQVIDLVAGHDEVADQLAPARLTVAERG